MVVDQRIAGQLAQGLARPMKAAAGGIYGGILDKSGQLIKQARFMPVAAAEGGGAAHWLQDVSLLSARTTVDQIEKAFPGVKDGDGRFVAELRMAGLAIAAKRRLMVLQAVEHAQLNQGLSLKGFLAEIEREATALNELEASLIDLLTRLSELPVRTGGGIFDRLHLSADDADELLKWPERLRDLRKREAPRVNSAGHVEIGFVLAADGSARILEPAVVAP